MKRTSTGVVKAFIESECRAAAEMAQRAVVAVKGGHPARAREYVRKARLCLMAVHLHMSDTPDRNAHADAERLDDALRTIERLLESRKQNRES